MKLVYLASPYSHPDPAMRQKRWELVCRVASELMTKHNVMVFSPIAECHGMAEHGGLPGNWDFWKEFDTRMIGVCDEFYVLCIDGWRDSVGLNAELMLAEQMNKDVYFVNWSEQLSHLVITEYHYRG